MKKIKLHTKKTKIVGDIWEVKAFIALDNYQTDQKGLIYLSPDCVTATEIEYWANSLIKELETIKRKAKKTIWSNHPSVK